MARRSTSPCRQANDHDCSGGILKDPIGGNRLISETSRQLAEELDRATDEYMRLQEIASAILRNAPSGIPLPHGQFRTMQAMKKTRSAYEVYRAAVKRYREFVDHGIPPDDEKKNSRE